MKLFSGKERKNDAKIISFKKIIKYTEFQKKYNMNFKFKIIYVLFLVTLIELSCFILWNYISEKRSFGVSMIHQTLDSPNLKFIQRLTNKPYGLYWNKTQFSDQEYGPQYDSNGYRNKEMNFLNDHKRILVFGGSTTASYPYVRNRRKYGPQYFKKVRGIWIKSSSI